MGDELKKTFGADIELVPGSNGIFDIVVDGKKIFSKFSAGRFPAAGEIIKSINQRR